MEASDNGENPKKLEMKSGGCHSDEGKIASFLKQHDSKKSDGLYKAVKGLKFKDILTGNLEFGLMQSRLVETGGKIVMELFRGLLGIWGNPVDKHVAERRKLCLISF